MPAHRSYTSGLVEPPGVSYGGDLNVGDDLTTAKLAVLGVSTFPNPAPSPASAVTLAELEEQLGRGAGVGRYRHLGAKSSVAKVVQNSAAEVSMLVAPLSMPKLNQDAVFRVSAHGILVNNSGGAVTATFRLKNLTDVIAIATMVVNLPTDASGSRPWRLDVLGEGNTFLADSVFTVGHAVVGAGTTDALQQAMSQSINSGPGSDPQDWDLTVQFSVANTNTHLTVYGAQIAYALPGD